ncbi:MAG: hypothetical protein ACOX5R_05465 [bacterium]
MQGWTGRALLVCTTEKTSVQAIDTYVEVMRQSVAEAGSLQTTTV